MKRIVIFSASHDPFMSGAERMVKEVVERLQDRYYFIIVTARQSRRIQNIELRIQDGRAYEIRRIGFGFKWDKFLYPILAPFYALKYRPTIVHAVMESYAGIALLLYYYIVKLVRPSLVLRPRRKLSLESVFNILTLQSGDLDLPEKQARIPQWLWRRIHTAPDLVVSIGNSMAERARRLGAKNVMVIPNGVDLKKVKETELRRTPQGAQATEGRKFGFEKQSHRIICVARLSPEKGIEYLIEAMPQVLQEVPDAELVLVGDGKLRETLNVKCQMSNVKCQFMGNLPHEKTLEEVAKSDVLVLPSLAEGMGIVLVEAQALGVPVIGTSIGGIPDVIEHEKTGLLVPVRNSQAIAEAIKIIFQNQILAEQMTHEAKKRLDKFDWQRIAAEYKKIYESQR